MSTKIDMDKIDILVNGQKPERLAGVDVGTVTFGDVTADLRQTSLKVGFKLHEPEAPSIGSSDDPDGWMEYADSLVIYRAWERRPKALQKILEVLVRLEGVA